MQFPDTTAASLISGCSPTAETTSLSLVKCEFESHHPYFTSVAQMGLEQGSSNTFVTGSNPVGSI